MQNELFGLSLFTDSPEPLRSYNRCIVVQNLMGRKEPKRAEEYLNSFNDKERLAIIAFQMKLNKEGKDAVYKYVLGRIDWDLVQ